MNQSESISARELVIESLVELKMVAYRLQLEIDAVNREIEHAGIKRETK